MTTVLKQPGSKWPTLNVGPAQTGQPPMECAMLLFPGFTALDLIGPQTVLCGPMTTHLVAKNMDPVISDTGITIFPTATFDEVPRDLDVLFVPGGPGQVDVFSDDETLSFLADRGARARWVTAVCTGSLMLGAAGLLDGYKATTHWAAKGLLPLFGAEPVDGRVAIDRNRITGGGVTAGIDFGLTILDTIYGEKIARAAQLLMEYDPAPPFDAGNPAGAGDDIVAIAMEVLGPVAEGTMIELGKRDWPHILARRGEISRKR
ncbi:DJ-1/PfpI family protein [Agrobacterium larrymoorei]|nr:DJ-1/PfpI family protein [Agrobacterium larrymoorei]